MRLKFTFLFIIMGLWGIGNMYAQSIGRPNQTDPQKEKLLQMSDLFHQNYLIQRAEVERVAKEKGWSIRQETNEGVTEIMYIDKFGLPQSYSTTNLNAGKTTNTSKIWSGGTSGLNLTGSGYIVGEWDGGGVLTTHQEFNNGSGTRVTQMDAPGSTNYHSTHVAGTIIAEGQVAAAHGMATEALLHAYEWTDDNAEMAAAAAGGLTLSNHSYGWNRGWNYNPGDSKWYWWGNTTISATEDYLFGFYDVSSQEWDQIAVNAPKYLIVKSSGNDRNDSYTGFHYAWNGTTWIWNNAVRDPDGGIDGYDCIDQTGVAKNVLTIGAVNAIPGGWTSPADVVMSSFSSWGPADDGRIKPDLVADGVNLYSSTNTGNADYTTLSGTSMATPNTTGTLVLLQDYYKSLRGGTMTAAALKGLVINTANEAGPANGPDYMFGWGLLNALGAATLIGSDNTQGGLIVESILVNGQTTDYTYYCNGSDINVTLCWTDPAGTPPAPSLNPTTLMLVNDLDVRVIGATENFPWMLNRSLPSANATKGDNIRDNVETVNKLGPAAGYYTVRVTSHSGTLSGGSQAYALIIKGMTTPPTDNYCSARSTIWGSYESITKVTMGSITNNSGRSPGGYGDYTGMVNSILKGTSETLSVTINGYPGDEGKAWVDWNQDGDFSDAGEEFVLGSGIGPYSVSIPAPLTALNGYTTMRVRLSYNAPTACGILTYGETEDYTINVLSHCEAIGGCDEFISNVHIGTINNSSTCGRYSDYRNLSTNIPVNSSAAINVVNGLPFYLTDQCGIWVDWNNDGDFSDAAESITVTGTPGEGPYTANIAPPVGTVLGSKTMRIRIAYNTAPLACGVLSFGEVEDYTLNITAALPNTWTGALSNYWHNVGNWSLGHIPTLDDPVVIANVGFQPVYVDNYVGITKEACSSVTINTGARLEIQTMELDITNDLAINGQLGMTDASGVIKCLGNVDWNSGSTANFSVSGVFWVYGDWNFNVGANANLALGNVDFTGAGTSWIRSYSANCALPNIGNYKTGSDWAYVSNISTQALTINGSIFNQPSANFGISSSYNVILKGNLNNNGKYDFTLNGNTGTFVFDGATQTISHSPTATGLFNNVRFSSSISTTASSNITIAKNLTIDQGTFNPGSTTVTLGGDWTNTVGASGFVEGTSRVVFNGTGHQYVLSNETFNIIETNMVAALRIDIPSVTVTCNKYDWTTGGVDVLAGTFTALELLDNGIYGNFYVNPGGTINLYNTGGWIDLNGNLFIYGGTLNVYGGAIDSDWSYSSNASLTMSGGVLDFKDRGIRVYNSGSYSFTSNVTGGTIRTVGKFDNQRPDFVLTAGTIEMYGPTDAYVSTVVGSNLYNLIINKTVTDMGSNPIPLFDREGNVVEQPLANTVLASSSLVTITGDLTINAGTFDLNAHTANVSGVVNINNATLKMTNAADKLTASSINWYSGSNDNINNGEIDVIYWNFHDGTNAMLSAPNLAVVKSGILPEDPDAEFGNFKAVSSLKKMDNPTAFYPVRVTGNCTFAASANWMTNVDWLIGGNLNIENSAAFNVYAGSDLLVGGSFALDGTLSLQSTATALVHGDFIFPSTGVLNVLGGTFTNDYSLSTVTLSGMLQFSSGFVEFPNRHVSLFSTFNDQITGGTFRFGKTFFANYPGVFQPTGGTTEFINASVGHYVQVTSDNFLNNMVMNKPGSTYIVYDNLTVKGNLAINAGTLSVGNKTINVGGNWNNLVGNDGFNEGTGTVVFDGALAADVLTAETFYNLNLNKTYSFFDGLELFNDVNVTNDLHNIDGNMELNDPANLYVTGNVSLDLGGGLNANDQYAPPLSGPQVTVGKNWTNANTTNTTEHGFDPGFYSTVTFNGTADQFLTTACVAEDFNNLKIDKASGKFRPNDNTQSFADVTIQKGAWEDNVTWLTHSLYRNFTVELAGSFLTTAVNNTVEFNGSQNSILAYYSSSGDFRNLLVNKTAGYSVTQATWTGTTLGGNLTVGTGTYNLNGNYLFISGDIAVNNTGILSLPAASQLELTNTTTVNINSGGRLNIAGTVGNQVIIRSNLDAARYALNINAGGTIAADYCQFKQMGANGVNVAPSGIVDLAHSFKGCTFQDGTAGGTLLTLNNAQALTIRNAVFPTNTWGGNSNVAKTLNTGHVYFIDYSGGFSGEAYDADVFNLLDWVPALIAAPTATPATICPGSSSQLHAVASGGFAPYTYSWAPAASLLNATSENPVATPPVTTQYSVLVTDALSTTVTSNVTVTVVPYLVPGVSIVASSNPCAPDEYVLFTATPVNGGTLPTYAWKVNGNPVGTGATFSTHTLNNHDQVTCVMTSNYPCVTGNPATSNVINMIVIPANLPVSGTINSPVSLCFDATNTITVAGPGYSFIVKNGARAVMIAGVKISYLPGTTVENGGYMHGYITTTNAYCGVLAPGMPAVVAGEGERETGPLPASQMFSIYPNPATSKFILQNKGNITLGQVQVEIYDLRGNKVLSTSFTSDKNHQITLPAFLPGLYFVKVISGDKIESFKLVVTR